MSVDPDRRLRPDRSKSGMGQAPRDEAVNRQQAEIRSSSWVWFAGGAAAATLSELGYNVKCFCFQDRRGARIARRARWNHAAKKYRTTATASTAILRHDRRRLRAREANVPAARSASTSSTSAWRRVPFAREYGGPLANGHSWGPGFANLPRAAKRTGCSSAHQALEEDREGWRMMCPPHGDADLVGSTAREALSCATWWTARIETHPLTQ
jgi:succinate dehydrogenase / fumarate reductase flavoprotein subunit